ncbi:hypothetical protein W97_03296 [Coniosporium apollinis CBS 100218]|uniref:Amine oxidase domain-containing protein n=1 Tax=Coniosporium apollinis (strain CBS 100218) TaxID=1168221 RepID=R7YR01_CONA1|nr:uncharacterized protein W97_03296 [Coniosporium apollinis CBS 100218]EON64066.1 hypothetical protein W97_03296 [Coniosporium apollinis CBS 100218]
MEGKPHSSQTYNTAGRMSWMKQDLGLPINKEKAAAGFDLVWSIISDAFKHSNENCANIAPNVSLKDLFREKLAERSLSHDDRNLVLQLAEMWGAFVGDSWERQSLKWFWLEECLDGENLFIADTHHAILQRMAKSAMRDADIHLSKTATSIEDRKGKDKDPRVLIRTEHCDFEFDEVVVTRDASYSRLEKVYIAFPVAFWDSPLPGAPNADSTSPTTSASFPSFAHFLHPTYVPDQQKSWTVELNLLSSAAVFGNRAQPVLLFTIYGPCATHVTSLIAPFSLASTQYFDVLNDFFRPYYSLLPNYVADHPDCFPSAVLATNWQNDDLAGNGSYTNFQISSEVGNAEEEVLLDEDVRELRAGMPEHGIWFAGEHTAPFVALGTSTGAYWSGESVGIRILGANGLLAKCSKDPNPNADVLP